MASRGPGEGPPFEYAWSCLVGDMAEMNETGRQRAFFVSAIRGC